MPSSENIVNGIIRVKVKTRDKGQLQNDNVHSLLPK